MSCNIYKVTGPYAVTGIPRKPKLEPGPYRGTPAASRPRLDSLDPILGGCRIIAPNDAESLGEAHGMGGPAISEGWMHGAGWDPQAARPSLGCGNSVVMAQTTSSEGTKKNPAELGSAGLWGGGSSGTRTQDPLIKSQFFLLWTALDLGWSVLCINMKNIHLIFIHSCFILDPAGGILGLACGNSVVMA